MMNKFDPKRHLIKLQGGRQYLPVAARLIWFREEHPDWGIETEPLTLDFEKQFAVFRAKVYNADGKLMAVGTKREDIKGFPDYMEKAETGSVGRALALCGYGTQFAPELDEVEAGRIVDSPRGGNRAVEGDPLPTEMTTCAVDDCAEVLTRSQALLSQTKFGGALLCPRHQKEHTAAAGRQAGAPGGDNGGQS